MNKFLAISLVLLLLAIGVTVLTFWWVQGVF